MNTTKSTPLTDLSVVRREKAANHPVGRQGVSSLAEREGLPDFRNRSPNNENTGQAVSIVYSADTQISNYVAIQNPTRIPHMQQRVLEANETKVKNEPNAGRCYSYSALALDASRETSSIA